VFESKSFHILQRKVIIERILRKKHFKNEQILKSVDIKKAVG